MSDVWALYVRHPEFDPDLGGIVFAVSGERQVGVDVVRKLRSEGYDASWGWEPPYEPCDDAEPILGFVERNRDYLYGIRKDYTMVPSEESFPPAEIVDQMVFDEVSK